MKRTRPLMEDLVDVLSATAGQEDAAAQRTEQQALIHKLIEHSRDGEVRATQLLITLKREADEAQAKEVEASDDGDVSAEDRAVLADYVRQVTQAGSGT